jgi:outer membrane protein TolC
MEVTTMVTSRPGSYAALQDRITYLEEQLETAREQVDLASAYVRGASMEFRLLMCEIPSIKTVASRSSIDNNIGQAFRLLADLLEILGPGEDETDEN